MFEFVSLLEKAREKSIYMRRQAADEADESLRAYIPPLFPVNSSYILYQLHIPRLLGQVPLHLLTVFLWRTRQVMTTELHLATCRSGEDGSTLICCVSER